MVPPQGPQGQAPLTEMPLAPGPRRAGLPEALGGSDTSSTACAPPPRAPSGAHGSMLTKGQSLQMEDTQQRNSKTTDPRRGLVCSKDANLAAAAAETGNNALSPLTAMPPPGVTWVGAIPPSYLFQGLGR